MAENFITYKEKNLNVSFNVLASINLTSLDISTNFKYAFKSS